MTIPPQIYIVVHVHSGTPILAEAYTDETAAIDCADERKAATNPEYGDVGVFDDHHPK